MIHKTYNYSKSSSGQKKNNFRLNLLKSLCNKYTMSKFHNKTVSLSHKYWKTEIRISLSGISQTQKLEVINQCL